MGIEMQISVNDLAHIFGIMHGHRRYYLLSKNCISRDISEPKTPLGTALN